MNVCFMNYCNKEFEPKICLCSIATSKWKYNIHIKPYTVRWFIFTSRDLKSTFLLFLKTVNTVKLVGGFSTLSSI